ncbi:hypothetical protein PLEOSDRAFT_155087 [Pleurotus ostreatus PC15]|uniref:DNA (cytosine-5-)-methyltransferase n=2 Tax=Pleurotus TaxID=5320 RepID=A0A067P3G2_PLEO1|nr:hypothetical protein CCMSSC00406_0000137 [Pleurotus cornucopiae]KDQ30406.1 hypothetical protein PLEOSDRAFT_155087 [Pleurotus ostreatus PC15]
MAPNQKSHPEPAFYSSDAGRPEIDEYDQDLVISGEEPPEPGATDKPVRFLTYFSVFDPRHHSEMVSIAELEEVDATKDRDFVATGFVSAFVEGDDEDEGEDEEKEAGMPFVRLGSLFRYYLDAENDAVWLETAQAWYILQEPSPGYGPFFQHFRHHTAAQPAGSSPPPSRSAKARALNIDSFVLLSENQTPTHVTPLIAQLAGTSFGDGLVVIGPRLPPPSKEEEDWRQRKELAKVRSLIRKAHQIDERRRKKSMYRMDKDNSWLSAIDLDGDSFKVGDIVLVVPGEGKEVKTLPLPLDVQDVPLDATIATYFWFARIISLSAEDDLAHLRWFEHGSYTVMEEFANPQQLYLNDLCSSVDINCLIETVNVHYQPSSRIPPQDYFYSSKYQHETATVIAVDNLAEDTAAAQLPPENCLVCMMAREKEHGTEIRHLETPPGVAYLGHTYHEGDFVEVLSEGPSGLCDIGQVVSFFEKSNQVFACIRCFGRISSLVHIQDFPPNYVKDEKELFASDEKKDVSVTSFIQPCVVLPPHEGFAILKWHDFINNSPHRFYVRYCFSSLHPASWTEGQIDNWWERRVCPQCPNDLVQLEGGAVRSDLYSNFVDVQLQTRLRTLDLFGGCGAFSAGMTQGATFIEVTHAVEISPSAAQTFMGHSSEVKMYNNCANLILHYFIKDSEGHGLETPTQLFDGKTPVPAPLKPKDIDMMTIGFPCQSHSGLNKFKKVNDPRSNLILTALSYIDFLRPKYCYFENVRGFLQFNIKAEQAGKHTVAGGIDMGGLKFLLRALDELGYQYHFALLQAAHYGTPQQRVRFFIIAAQMGNPLPGFPQPSHYFPSNDSLTINCPIGIKISPIVQTVGSYVHPFVTVGDAISDLPRFDWEHPDPDKITAEDHERRQLGIPALPCWKTEPWCGPTGHETAYFHPARTTFQVQCRLNEPSNLQQYTKVFIPATVARVISIPLWAKADYRDLPVDMHEWQTSNPVSAIAKSGYKAGLYGRLDQDRWFSTTITNINPTAKQSKVLNPYCKRMVTVRELARSQGFPDDFEFQAIGNNIITMHRQIGNAVPWPLSRALGQELGKALYNKWLADRRNAIIVSLDSP